MLAFLSNIPGFAEMANVRYDKDNKPIADAYAVTLARLLPVVGNILPDMVTGYERSGYHTDDKFRQVAEALIYTSGPFRDMPVNLEEQTEWNLQDLTEELRLLVHKYQMGQAPTEAWIRPSDEEI